jgi:hypothetical protein
MRRRRHLNWPRCSATTKTGQPCRSVVRGIRNAAGRHSLPAEDGLCEPHFWRAVAAQADGGEPADGLRARPGIAIAWKDDPKCASERACGVASPGGTPAYVGPVLSVRERALAELRVALREAAKEVSVDAT